MVYLRSVSYRRGNKPYVVNYINICRWNYRHILNGKCDCNIPISKWCGVLPCRRIRARQRRACSRSTDLVVLCVTDRDGRAAGVLTLSSYACPTETGVQQEYRPCRRMRAWQRRARSRRGIRWRWRGWWRQCGCHGTEDLLPDDRCAKQVTRNTARRVMFFFS